MESGAHCGDVTREWAPQRATGDHPPQGEQSHGAALTQPPPSNLGNTISSQLGQLTALETSEAFKHSDGTDAGRAHRGKITGVVFWVRVVTHLSITAPLPGRRCCIS